MTEYERMMKAAIESHERIEKRHKRMEAFMDMTEEEYRESAKDCHTSLFYEEII